MRYLAVMLLILMPVSSGCASNRPMPMPVVGVDIATVQKGEICPITGTVFSPFYLNEFLQWKESR